MTTRTLFQNNIFHSASSSIVPNSPFYGNVFSYNYVDSGVGASIIEHGLGGMNLYEGNNVANFSADTIHGPHAFETLFRNHHDGRAHNPSQTETQASVALYSNNRFFNVVGNVFGASNWSNYQSLMAHSTSVIYELGWRGTGSGTPVSNDPNVSRTLMRWGNWDSVTSTNDNGTNDTTGTRFVAGEVPSGIAHFANPVPESQTLPNSLYLTTRPDAWWGSPYGTVPWPPIGPDVSGGSLASSGGHAYKIPARLCFENAALDSAFPASSPRIRVFNAGVCYPPSVLPPAQPGNLKVTP
jgi:hypothetical protein